MKALIHNTFYHSTIQDSASDGVDTDKKFHLNVVRPSTLLVDEGLNFSEISPPSSPLIREAEERYSRHLAEHHRSMYPIDAANAASQPPKHLSEATVAGLGTKFGRDGSPSTNNDSRTDPSRASVTKPPLPDSALSGLRIPAQQERISPFSHANPYYGYPAVYTVSPQTGARLPQPQYSRRRKRDLARTLLYLTMLRLLKLRREALWRIDTVVKWLMEHLRLQRRKMTFAGPESRSRSVQQAEARSASRSGEVEISKRIASVVLFLAFFVVLRGTWWSRLRQICASRASSSCASSPGLRSLNPKSRLKAVTRKLFITRPAGE